MDSTPSSKAVEPRDALIARADEQLAHAYGQIKRADEELARVSEQITKMERDATRPPSAGPGPQSQSSPGKSTAKRSAPRALIGLLLAACIIGTALVMQS